MTKKALLTFLCIFSSLNTADRPIPGLKAFALRDAVMPRDGQTKADTQAIKNNKATIKSDTIPPMLIASGAWEYYFSHSIEEFRKLPDEVKKTLPPISIQDLIDTGKIPSFSLQGFEFDLLELNLSDYYISNLTGLNNISNIENVALLKLNNNLITEINNKTFDRLTNLDTLNLSHNQITEINNSTFNRLQRLKEIYLSDNQIATVENNTFNRLQDLKIIDLSHNQINRIGNHAFSGFSDLASLDLSHNQITTVENSTFHESRIAILNVSHNRISTDTLQMLRKQAYVFTGESQNPIPQEQAYNQAGHSTQPPAADSSSSSSSSLNTQDDLADNRRGQKRKAHNQKTKEDQHQDKK